MPMPTSQPNPRLTPTQWLICTIAVIGFAFDIYEILMLPLIVRPALLELTGAAPGSPEFQMWVGRLFYIPAFAGGIFGLLGIVIALLQDPEISNRVPPWMTTMLHLPWRPDLFALGPKILGPLATSNLFGLIMFLLLSGSLFYFARKKLD